MFPELIAVVRPGDTRSMKGRLVPARAEATPGGRGRLRAPHAQNAAPVRESRDVQNALYTPELQTVKSFERLYILEV